MKKVEDCVLKEGEDSSSCPLASTAVDVRWMKRLGGWTFTAVMAVLALVVLSIYNSGYQVRGIEQNAKDVTRIDINDRNQDKSISELRQNQKVLEKSVHELEEDRRFSKGISH